MCYCHCPPLHIHYAPSTIHMEDQPAPAGAPCFIPPSEFYFTAAFRFYLLFFVVVIFQLACIQFLLLLLPVPPSELLHKPVVHLRERKTKPKQKKKIKTKQTKGKEKNRNKIQSAAAAAAAASTIYVNQTRRQGIFGGEFGGLSASQLHSIIFYLEGIGGHWWGFLFSLRYYVSLSFIWRTLGFFPLILPIAKSKFDSCFETSI